jgi:adenine-specific DNA methylase
MPPESLPLFARPVHVLARTDASQPRAIEEVGFPFEQLGKVAQVESWRKEIHRPVYHLHKWWAQRLGSVFRAIVLGTFAPAGSDVLDLFYTPARLNGFTVFDPFMGSGTTVGETLKMGGRAIGRDINPVAYFLVRNALTLPNRDELIKTFHAIEHDVARDIARYYQARLPDGRHTDVLYYFWVKQARCPHCHEAVDLFSSYVFARHAYRMRNPEAQCVCPGCGDINVIRFDSPSVPCRSCRLSFDPHAGPARGLHATCPRCSDQKPFAIAKAIRGEGTPPSHRLYAKLVLLPNGEKAYLPADAYDLSLYARAARELGKRDNPHPVVHIRPGYNTNQALNYGYLHWHEMFNARQLLCLDLLATRIQQVPDERMRDVFCCLFTGTLEFNNMFASYKGEGTGAVRHMFSHHILKPERQPLEAHPWGTPRSSGSFSTLFRSRILRALDYCESPFEVRAIAHNGRASGAKVSGLSLPLRHKPVDTGPEFVRGGAVYLSCGDSSQTDIATGTVDAVITDPPFFDNVHYSQLADFFHVWQRHVLGASAPSAADTTRSNAEVQQTDPSLFATRLGAVWKECHRVLKDDGLLVFTYHHSRNEGWRCVLESLVGAHFVVVRAHPIKSEMSVATPKHQAREPIDVDMIVVCRKQDRVPTIEESPPSLVRAAVKEAASQLTRLRAAGHSPSKNDVRVVLMAQTIVRLSQLSDRCSVQERFEIVESSVEKMIDTVHARLGSSRRSAKVPPSSDG